MTQIAVNPRELETVAGVMQRQADALRTTERRLRQVLSSLEWVLRSRGSIDTQAAAATQDAVSLAERGEGLGRFLHQVSRSFLELDQTGAERIGQSAGLLQRALQAELAAAKHDWFKASISGDKQGMDDAHQRASSLREMGAVETPEMNSEIAAQYQPQDQARFDGEIPAPGTTEARSVWRPTSPAVTSDSSNRSTALYNDVINQFAVGNNPRYAVRNTDGRPGDETFCNLFLWDVTSAMGAPIPHWVQGNGVPYPDDLVAAAGGYGEVSEHAWEMNANAASRWLDNHGEAYGWREATAEEAQRMADQGRPAVAAWDSRSEEAGHVAVLRPSSPEHPYDPAKGPVIAQAGGTNSNYSTVSGGFGSKKMAQVVYYVHD